MVHQGLRRGKLQRFGVRRLWRRFGSCAECRKPEREGGQLALAYARASDTNESGVKPPHSKSCGCGDRPAGRKCFSMRWSTYFIPTLREDRADAEVDSQKLLLRACVVRQPPAGLYSY